MGVVTIVVASFKAALETFKRIKDQQPSDEYITSILEVLVPILYALRWDVENGIHNLVCLLLAEAPHVKKYNEKFPLPTKRPGIYSTTLDKVGKEFVRVKGEATHKAKQEDWVLYDVVEKETGKLSGDNARAVFYHNFWLCPWLSMHVVFLCYLKNKHTWRGENHDTFVNHPGVGTS
jgi:hypothetical protein